MSLLYLQKNYGLKARCIATAKSAYMVDRKLHAPSPVATCPFEEKPENTGRLVRQAVIFTWRRLRARLGCHKHAM